jgi:uncharacterized cupin superfamily protein
MKSLLSSAAADDSAWQPFTWIDYEPLEGDPDIHILPLQEHENGVMLAGLATAQKSKFDLLMPFNETLYVIEGAIRTELEDGTVMELRPGDSGTFAKGSRVIWTIEETLKEFFVLTD